VTCWSCAHVQRDGDQPSGAPRLWCVVLARPATSRCGAFQYEPGADEAERWVSA
jgi:hypothetical protein